MNDRERLELAAKAAGIQLVWGGPEKDMPRRTDTLELWNPRDSDGDALRLAVKLKLTPMMRDFGCDVTDFVGIGCAYEKWSSDPCSATRRAIVRAAAEIGRQMQEGGK